MSSSQKSVNIGGAIRSLGSLGFRNQDLIPEGIDNSLDAGASKISITIDKHKNFILADNAKGMSKVQLQERFILYNDSDANNQKQGRFGIGNKAMHSLLSGNETSTKSISYGLNPPRIAGSGPDVLKHHEIVLDWPAATTAKESEFTLHATPLEDESKEEWKKYAIDKAKPGTVDIIRLSGPMYKYISENIQKLVEDLSRMYTQSLEEGVEITVTFLEKPYKLEPINLLAVSVDQGTGAKPLTKIVREIWAKADGTLRVYYRDGGKNWVYWGKKPDTNKYGNIAKYPATDEGYTKVGLLHISQAYDPAWSTGKGGIYIKRNKKITHHIPVLVTGGSPKQIAERETRTIVMFEATKEFDTLFGILVNKSHIVKINDILGQEIKDIHDGFVSFPKEKKAKSASPPQTPRSSPSIAPVPAPSPAAAASMLGYQEFRKLHYGTVKEETGLRGGELLTEVARRYQEYKNQPTPVAVANPAPAPAPAPAPKPAVKQPSLSPSLPPTPPLPTRTVPIVNSITQPVIDTETSSTSTENDASLTRPARQTVVVTARRVPQSEYDLMAQVIKFVDEMNKHDLKAILLRASKTVKDDMSRQKDTLVDILESIKKI